jgi:superfamily I DNA/RNA helicase
VGAEGNICVVGDDDQSIYGFRGASIDTIHNFQHEFSGACVIKLEENYRSREEILSLANSVIRRATSRFPKRLRSQCGRGGLVVRERTLNETAESKQIVDQLVERRRCGRQWRDMAVLVRVGSDSKSIRIELKDRDIPFQSSAEQSAEDHVAIMTLHRSKGLEFPVVFLPAVEEDTLPHYYSSRASNGIEEERRLFYVGVTRAQQELVLSTCSVRRGRLRTVSRFLSEVGLQ